MAHAAYYLTLRGLRTELWDDEDRNLLEVNLCTQYAGGAAFQDFYLNLIQIA